MNVHDHPDGRGSRVTIRQVAELAGVSIATVSRVANGRSDVSDQTRLAVERVIREHGYLTAGRSRLGRASLVGLAVPLVRPGYFASIVAGAAEALYEHGMRAVLCPTWHSHDRESSLLERLSSGETDGAILVLPRESDAELQALAHQGFGLVVVDPRTEVTAGIPVVCAAHLSGAMQATGHLLELGHRRIGAIAGPPGWMASDHRLRAYHGTLAGAGIAPDPELVEHADFTIRGGRAAADRLLSLTEAPTAIFAFNDGMAVGALRAAAARGVRVPDDLSVVGFDDTLEAKLATPALTTVRQPLAELGRTAVSLLLRQIHNRPIEPLRVELQTRLVIRDSTAPATTPEIFP
jgi:LacI family transcriptional regulator